MQPALEKAFAQAEAFNEHLRPTRELFEHMKTIARAPELPMYVGPPEIWSSEPALPRLAREDIDDVVEVEVQEIRQRPIGFRSGQAFEE